MATGGRAVRVCWAALRTREALLDHAVFATGAKPWASSTLHPPTHQKACSVRNARSWRWCIRHYSTGINESTIPAPSNEESALPGGEVTVVYFRGLPQVTVPLPSRREMCRFTLRPVTHTVGDFLRMIQLEDRGVDRVAVKAPDGTRIASSSTIEILMEHDFNLVINDRVYRVKSPQQERVTKEEMQRLSDVRNLVSQLYEALNVEEHQLLKERDICSQLEELKVQLEPLEKRKLELEEMAERRTTVLTWVGLGLMSVQFGILARLTWWEYSWDIMEPVTYFVTYGTAMAGYAYFVLTRQEYLLPDVKDRQFLIGLHKKARKTGLDVETYNKLKDGINRLEADLRRLRDPLQIHLPPSSLEANPKTGVASSASFQKAQEQIKALLNIKK